MNFKKRVTLTVLALTATLTLSACETKLMYVGNSTASQIIASYKHFSGTEVKKVSLKRGEILAVDYSSEVTKGELEMKLYDPDHKLIKEFKTNGTGTERLKAEQDGKYKFEIIGSSTRGKFKIHFKVE